MMDQFWICTLADGRRVLACDGLRYPRWDYFYGFAAVVAILAPKGAPR